MGIRSLTKQIQSSYKKRLHLSRAARVGANPRVFCFYLCLPRKPLGRYDFQVCVSDMGTLFICRDL